MRGSGDQQGQDALVREILAYLVAHPEARDTLEGISTVWLSAERLGYSRRVVQTALKRLVREGWMVERSRPHTEPTFGANRTRLDEVKALLSGFAEWEGSVTNGGNGERSNGR